ncbi:MAG: FadR/GntR family transcriptional regulator [Ruthenibacterium sp.]
MTADNSTLTFDNFKPVVTKRASEAIYEQVKGLIISGELKAGGRLPSERNMMEMFQRSRPTIREALRMLERSGYIRTIAGSNGAIIMEPNNKNVQQTMEDALQVGHISLEEMSEYRKISEAAAVAWAAERSTDEDITLIEAVLQQMQACVTEGDYEKFIDMDSRFHEALALAAKNTVSVAMNKTFSKLNRTFVKGKMATMTSAARKKMCVRVQNMHKEILEAVKNHEVEKAKEAIEVHLNAFGSDLK